VGWRNRYEPSPLSASLESSESCRRNAVHVVNTDDAMVERRKRTASLKKLEEALTKALRAHSEWLLDYARGPDQPGPPRRFTKRRALADRRFPNYAGNDRSDRPIPPRALKNKPRFRNHPRAPCGTSYQLAASVTYGATPPTLGRKNCYSCVGSARPRPDVRYAECA
jgi:hypothetical protein